MWPVPSWAAKCRSWIVGHVEISRPAHCRAWPHPAKLCRALTSQHPSGHHLLLRLDCQPATHIGTTDPTRMKFRMSGWGLSPPEQPHWHRQMRDPWNLLHGCAVSQRDRHPSQRVAEACLTCSSCCGWRIPHPSLASAPERIPARLADQAPAAGPPAAGRPAGPQTGPLALQPPCSPHSEPETA